jgi:hypothetical protein
MQASAKSLDAMEGSPPPRLIEEMNDDVPHKCHAIRH